VRLVAVIILLAGCDRLLGISHVPDAGTPSDSKGSTPDVPPPGCSTDAPLFGNSPKSLGLSPCHHYAARLDGTHVIMQCGTGIFDAPVDSASTTAQTLGTTSVGAPRVGATGKEMLVTDSAADAIVLYMAAGNNTWARLGPLYPTSSDADDVSQPTDAISGERHFIYYSATGKSLHELIAAQPWTNVTAINATLDVGRLGGVAPVSGASLSYDGLRMVFEGQVSTDDPDVYYLSRASADSQFDVGTLTKIYKAVGVEGTPYMTEDCSALYFTGPNSTVMKVAR
jgi:hypothetical protein